MDNLRDEIIVSVCDHSGRWSQPYVDLGYRVLRLDPKHGPNIDQLGRGITEGPALTGPSSVLMPDNGEGWPMTVGIAARMLAVNPLIFGSPVVGALFAPPCTDFTVSGNQWWGKKDEDGDTAISVRIVEECLALKDACKETLRWWALENPVGRMRRLVPLVGQPLLTFNPCDYAGLADNPETEAYTKKTQIYGEFNADLPEDYREPKVYTRVGKNGKVYRGSWLWANLGGKSERTKELRSQTPIGFSRAFAQANP